VLHDYALYKSTFTLLLYFTKILATKPNETKLTLVQVAVYAMIRPINGLGPPVFYNNSARDPHEPMLRVNGCSSRLETFTTNGNGCGIVLGGSTMQWGAWRGLLWLQWSGITRNVKNTEDRNTFTEVTGNIKYTVFFLYFWKQFVELNECLHALRWPWRDAEKIREIIVASFYNSIATSDVFKRQLFSVIRN